MEDDMEDELLDGRLVFGGGAARGDVQEAGVQRGESRLLSCAAGAELLEAVGGCGLLGEAGGDGGGELLLEAAGRRALSVPAMRRPAHSPTRTGPQTRAGDPAAGDGSSGARTASAAAEDTWALGKATRACCVACDAPGRGSC